MLFLLFRRIYREKHEEMVKIYSISRKARRNGEKNLRFNK